jgi:hypothetical protein
MSCDLICPPKSSLGSIRSDLLVSCMAFIAIWLLILSL